MLANVLANAVASPGVFGAYFEGIWARYGALLVPHKSWVWGQFHAQIGLCVSQKVSQWPNLVAAHVASPQHIKGR